MSPRQRPFDDSRRPSLQGLNKPVGGSLRGAMPNHLSPRRYGSIGTGNGMHSPSSRPSFLPPPPPVPQQPPMQHPLSISSSPPNNLARRHTSADIRVEGWQGGVPPPPHQSTNHASSPYASGQNSSAYPSSPRGPGHPHEHQQLRDALAQYELPRPLIPNSNANPQHSGAHNINGSRHSSPPPPPGGSSGGPHDPNTASSTNPPSSSTTTNQTPSFSTPHQQSHHQHQQQQHLPYANPNDAGWQLPGPRYPFKAPGLETPPQGSATRRSSMASNVHSLLNPADTAEREGEDEGAPPTGLGIGGAGGGAGLGGFEERKRKRVQ